MTDITCPYCNHEYDLDYADGHGCEEDNVYEEECPKCEKYFVFTTWIDFHHNAKKADCLNDGKHNWKPTVTVPRRYTKMRCSMCDESRQCNEKEKKQLGYWEHEDNDN